MTQYDKNFSLPTVIRPEDRDHITRIACFTLHIDRSGAVGDHDAVIPFDRIDALCNDNSIERMCILAAIAKGGIRRNRYLMCSDNMRQQEKSNNTKSAFHDKKKPEMLGGGSDDGVVFIMGMGTTL